MLKLVPKQPSVRAEAVKEMLSSKGVKAKGFALTLSYTPAPNCKCQKSSLLIVSFGQGKLNNFNTILLHS